MKRNLLLTFWGVVAFVAAGHAQCSTSTPTYVPPVPGVTWPNWNTTPTGCPSAGATQITATTNGTRQNLNTTGTTYYAANGTYVYGEINQSASTNRMTVVVCQGAVLWLGVGTQSSTHLNVVVMPGGTLIPNLSSNSSKVWKGKTYVYGAVVSSNEDLRIENINSGDSSMTFIAPSGIFQVAGTTPGSPAHNTQLYFASGSGIMGIYNEGSIDVSDLYVNSSGTAICSNNANSCLRIRNSVPALNTDDQLAANAATGGYMIFDATSGSVTLNKRVSSSPSVNVCTFGGDWCKSGGGCCIKTAGCTTGSPFAGSTLNNATKCATLPASCSIPLKAYLAGFKVTRSTEGVKVSWITSSQEKSKWFQVEKSKNGIDWAKVGEIPSAGDYSGSLEYALHDHSPWPGDTYYRLQEVDFEGKGTVYAVDLLHIPLDETEFLLSPNPSSGTLTIRLGDSFEKYEMEILDTKGSSMGKYTLYPGSSTFTVSVVGMYLAKLKVGTSVLVKKFVVL